MTNQTTIQNTAIELAASFKTQAAAKNYIEVDDQIYFESDSVKSEEIRARILMERYIIRFFVKSLMDCKDVQYSISINDGGDWPVVRSRDLLHIMDHIGACDEERLYVRIGLDKDATKVGQLYLVYGNDGWDVIADNTATDAFEALLKDTNELVDALGNL